MRQGCRGSAGTSGRHLGRAAFRPVPCLRAASTFATGPAEVRSPPWGLVAFVTASSASAQAPALWFAAHPGRYRA